MIEKQKSPYSNPYWAEHIKPHPVETQEIRLLCLRAFELAMSTYGVASVFTNADAVEEGVDTLIPKLLKLYSTVSERDLSNALLKLSILVRTLEDQMLSGEKGAQVRAELASLNSSSGPFGVVYSDGVIDLTIRECCNKIIHAEDFRPVYDNDGDSNDGGWSMNGTLELKGVRNGAEWSISISLPEFLEAALDFCDIVEGTHR